MKFILKLNLMLILIGSLVMFTNCSSNSKSPVTPDEQSSSSSSSEIATVSSSTSSIVSSSKSDTSNNTSSSSLDTNSSSISSTSSTSSTVDVNNGLHFLSSQIYLKKGDKKDLIVWYNGLDVTSKVTFTAKDNGIMVDEFNGAKVVYGIKFGQSILEASYNGQKTSITVNVVEAISSVNIYEPSVILNIGETEQLRYIVNIDGNVVDNMGKTDTLTSLIKFVSKNASVVKIMDNGMMIGKSGGKTTIVMSYVADTTICDSVVVSVRPNPLSMELYKKDLSGNYVAFNDTYIDVYNTSNQTLYYKILPNDASYGLNISKTVSDSLLMVTVSNSANSDGYGTIVLNSNPYSLYYRDTATTLLNISSVVDDADIEVNITAHVKLMPNSLIIQQLDANGNLTSAPAIMDVSEGDKFTLYSKVIDEKADQGVTWKSTNTELATVIDGVVEVLNIDGVDTIYAISKINPLIYDMVILKSGKNIMVNGVYQPGCEGLYSEYDVNSNATVKIFSSLEGKDSISVYEGYTSYSLTAGVEYQFTNPIDKKGYSYLTIDYDFSRLSTSYSYLYIYLYDEFGYIVGYSSSLYYGKNKTYKISLSSSYDNIKKIKVYMKGSSSDDYSSGYINIKNIYLE